MRKFNQGNLQLNLTFNKDKHTSLISHVSDTWLMNVYIPGWSWNSVVRNVKRKQRGRNEMEITLARAQAIKFE